MLLDRCWLLSVQNHLRDEMKQIPSQIYSTNNSIAMSWKYKNAALNCSSELSEQSGFIQFPLSMPTQKNNWRNNYNAESFSEWFSSLFLH